MTPETPALKHLILLGGGHAQIAVLKDLAMRPIEGLRITLISRDVLTPYSGMLPGYLEGVYSGDEINIDLSHLARLANARFIHGAVERIDADNQQIFIKNRPPMDYDILSINIGSNPSLAAIEGAAEYSIPVKPISTLLDRLDPIFNEAKSIAVIGGGAAGVEVALSLHHRLAGRGVSFSLIHSPPCLLPEFPAKAAEIVSREMKDKNIALYTGAKVNRIGKDLIEITGQSPIKADKIVVATAGKAPAFLAQSGLDLDDRGFIAVRGSLQSTSHSNVFASGDSATVISAPRPKAGVFAVRAGPILAHNLRQYIFGKTLKQWQPQRHYMALLGTGGSRAMLIRGSLVLPPSRIAWRLKEWIDRKFITKFTDLPKMESAPAPLLSAMVDAGDTAAKALTGMRCLGCGGKAGWADLDAAIAAAEDFLQSQGFCPKISRMKDSAALDMSSLSSGFVIMQSIDSISALIDDPFMLGRIAALHALSDLFASHAKPHSALALLGLPAALPHLQKDDITQLLAGAMLALYEHGAVLAGGHTAESPQMQIGFAVTGISNGAKIRKPQDGSHLILTKPLGIGTIMAAHRQGLASGAMRDKAIAIMAESNDKPAEIAASFGRYPMTDVTGFGLARHCLSLLSQMGRDSAEFVADAIPYIDGAAGLSRAGVVSSLAAANAESAPIHGLSLPLLHDPQTSGGLLMIVPKGKSAAVLKALQAATVNAAIIGRLRCDGLSQIRTVKQW